MHSYTSIPFSFGSYFRLRFRFMDTPPADIDERCLDTPLATSAVALFTHLLQVGPSGVEPVSPVGPGVYGAGRFPETIPGPLNDESRLGFTGRLQGKNPRKYARYVTFS